MKKKSKILLLGVTIFIACITSTMTVQALPQTLINKQTVDLPSNSMYSQTGLHATYNSAQVDYDVSKIYHDGNTEKTAFIMSVFDGNKYIVRKSYDKKIIEYTCNFVNFGYIGHGNWMYSVASISSTYHPYVGWLGIHTLISY